ncbi:archaellar assembly protein FlaJ [Halobacteria archaeon AArc-dxtr1]|nr:archaellar assembly protein FlaJ [Halobacteria archaeon AArc-dxtr1]
MATKDNASSLASVSQSIIRSYDEMDFSTSVYLLGIVLPAFAFFLLTVVVTVLIDAFLLVRLLIPVLGLLALGAAVAYPRIALDARRVQMENRYHLFVIHMTVLATTNIDRMEILRELAKEEEYGELTVEVQRIVDLVDVWHLSLDEACRRRAKEVPSESIADLFERMAYTLEAGQQIDDFLTQEQDVLIDQYSTVYQQSLSNLDVLKDLYLSIIISMTFALVFAIVLPLLTGNDPTLTAGIVIVLFVFVQLGFFFIIRETVPDDPIWYLEDGYRTTTKKRLLGATVLGVGLTVVLTGLLSLMFLSVLPGAELFGLHQIPYLLVLPIATAPLLITGVVFWYEERRVFERDRSFPSFIRALGTSESVKQSTTTDVLSTLRSKDFGHLSKNIDDLYRRLNMRISTEKSWRYFTGDTCSHLIQKFSEMYLVGRKMGGSPKQLGELISQNMSAIINLREERKQKVTTLIGVVYGITVAATFAFFIGLELAILLSGFDIDTGEQTVADSLIYTEQYNIPLLRYLLTLVLVFNALISSLLIRAIDGGHLGNSYLHFVLLLWLGAITGTLTERLIDMLITVDL